MSRRIAPLNALRAFEASARHLSFTRAAEELHVTPAAVSHQIKGLEEYFGAPLFRRLTRALLLTDMGQRALPLLRDGFDLLAEASDRLSVSTGGNFLTVSAAPSISAKWLVARLERFRTAHPDIEVRLDASERLTDFQRDGVDIAIRFGGGVYRGLHSARLFGTTVFPVYSPALAAGPRPLTSPGDLAGHTLLHIECEWGADDESWPNWRMWLKAADATGVDPDRGPRFNDVAMAVQTAIDGHGVVLASDILIADDLAAGRLVRPFEQTVSMDFGYFVVCPKERANDTKVAAFRDWLLAEAAATG